MSLPRALVRPFALPLRHPLATAHGPIDLRRGFLVELRDGQGQRGFGEATPLPEFGTEDLRACRAALWRELSEGLSHLASGALDEGEACIGGARRADAPCARAV